MPDFSRWGGNGGDPSLNAISRTDRYLDALAAEQPVYATDPADAELANLMAGWRDEVRRPPARVASQRDAEIVLHRALATRQRTRMSMAVMGSVAAALLCLGGFGAVVYSASPGDALYGLRVSLFGEQQATRDDRVALAAQTEMQQVQQLIEQGNWDAAQDKLQTVTSTVQTVEDPQRQQELQRQLNDLTVKVETRDPNATVPQSAPFELPSTFSCHRTFRCRRHRFRCHRTFRCRRTFRCHRCLALACRCHSCLGRSSRRIFRCRRCRSCLDPLCRRIFRCHHYRRFCCRSRYPTGRSRFPPNRSLRRNRILSSRSSCRSRSSNSPNRSSSSPSS